VLDRRTTGGRSVLCRKDRVRHLLTFALAAGCSGCAGVPGVKLQSGVDFGEERGRIWVRASWEVIKPSTDIDDVVDQLCPAVGRLDRARAGDDGLEYCGLLYSLPDGTYHASVPSSLGLRAHSDRGRHKSCRLPTSLREARAGVTIKADYHSHPWPDAPFTDRDLSSDRQRWSIRIQFDTTCRIFKYEPHSGEPRPGEVFLRVGKSWRLHSIVRVEDKPLGIPTPSLQEVL
jgi:hypothetical protein